MRILCKKKTGLMFEVHIAAEKKVNASKNLKNFSRLPEQPEVRASYMW